MWSMQREEYIQGLIGKDESEGHPKEGQADQDEVGEDQQQDKAQREPQH